MVSETEKFFNSISVELSNHPLREFYKSIESTAYSTNPEIKIIYESLAHFYINGFKLFMSEEWGVKNDLSHKVKNYCKPFSRLYKRLYDLCKEAHSLQDSTKVAIPYKNAFRWFGSCLLEFLYLDIYEILNKTANTDFCDIWHERYKILKDINKFPPESQFKIEYNPCFCTDIARYSIGLISLIEVSQCLAKKLPDFDKKYWKPFLNAIYDISQLKNNRYVKQYRIDFEEKVILSQNIGTSKRKTKFTNPKKYSVNG